MPDGTIRVVIDSAGSVRGAKRVKRDLQDIRTGFNQTDKQIKTTQGSFKELTKTLIGPVSIVAGLTAVTAALTASIRVSTQFQKSISELSAITGATGESLEFLSDQAKELGRTTTLSASEVAEGFKLVASAKPDLLESGEALTEVTKQAITLAEAAGITLPDAALALGGALNQFQADADQAGRFINVLAAGSQRGASEIPELTQALKTAGTVAAGANLSFEDTIANIETLAEVNLKGAEAGTQLRNIILRLQKEGVDQLNPSIVGLTQALRNLNAQERSDVELLKLFGTESFAASQALLQRTDRTEQLTEAITGTLTAEEQAIINTDNLEGKTKNLNSAIEGLGIAFGTILLPSLEDTTSFFTNYINVVTDALNATIDFTTGISDAVGDAGNTNQAFLRNIADKTIEEIEDRIRKENQVLNDLLEFSASDASSAIAGATLGISAAFEKGDIDEAERFIAILKKARAEAIETQKAQGTGGGIGDTDAASAAAAEAAKLAAETAKREAELAKQREKLAKDAERAAERQQQAFERLRGSLVPVAQAQRDLEKAESVLNMQRELGKISGEELFDLQLRLRGEFEASIDPLEALNDKLEEEIELAKLTSEQKAVELRLRQEVDEIKRQGVDLTDEQVNALRDEITQVQQLTESQTASVTTQKEVNAELELQKQILEEIKGPQEDLNMRVAALSALLAADSISLQEFNEQLADLRAQTLEGQTSIEAGFERGFIKAQENLNDFASLSEKIVTDSFQGMEDGIVDFAKTGKIEVGSLVDQILEDFVRLQSRQALSGLFGAAGGQDGGSGLFGLVSGLLNQGGGGTPGGAAGGGNQAGGGGFAQFAGIASSLLASNQDGGIETSPTISAVAEKGPEAIIPLKGGSVPVEVTERGGGKPPVVIQNTFNISTPDPGSFGRSTGQIGNMVGQSFQGAISRNG